MNDTLLTLLQRQIEHEISQRSEYLARGNASDLAEYKLLGGVIRGLDIADELIKNLAKKIEADDDDDADQH